MKYAIIAALLATSTQAATPTGCKAGIKSKVYSDSKCKTEAVGSQSLVQDDIAKTAKCVSEQATKEDEAALKFSQKTLEDKQAKSTKALKAFQRTSALDVQKADGSGAVPVEEKYEKDYAAFKAAYVTKMKSYTVVHDYLAENASAKNDVLNYAQEYMKLWKLQDVPKDEQKATDITNQEAVVAPLEEKLPKNLDVKNVQQAVKDEKAFQDLMTKVDPADQDNLKAYLVLDMAKDEASAAVTAQKNVVTSAEGKVDAHTFSYKMTCDAKTGVKVQVWDGVECKDDVQQEFAAKWGACTKFGDEYYKITGASALQAAAVAVIAFAGSQF